MSHAPIAAQPPALTPQPIKGAVPRTDTPEGIQLWAACPYLRPRDHSEWLRHFINLGLNLAKLQAGWVPAAGKLEWKLECPRFVFEDMQHAHRLQERLAELPKPGTDVTTTAPAFAAFFEAIAPAEHAAIFYETLFSTVKPALIKAGETYLARCDAILDAPIIYTLGGVLFEQRRQLDEAREFFVRHPLPADPAAHAAYRAHVQACLEALGSLTPDHHPSAVLPASPVRTAAGPSPRKTVHDPALRLSEGDRFPANAAEGNPCGATLQEIIYHNATEWQVVAPMCHVFYAGPAMPLEFYVDFSRHIWDECRHAAMGFRRLQELGYRREDFTFPGGGDKPESPEGYIATLVLIGETCSFNRKRGSIIPFLRQGDYRSAMLPEVDCIDEQMHVGYGHKWIPELYVRARNDQRGIRHIGAEVRREFIGTIERLRTASDADRQAILASLPVLCSSVEFQHLDFAANAPAPAGAAR